MAGLKIKGDTSGSTTITAPNTGTDETIELSSVLASKLDLAGGKILQIVRATDSTERTTTSISYVDITGMSVTITPQKSNSGILVVAIMEVWSDATQDDNGTYLRITDSSDNAISGAEECIAATYIQGYTGAGTRRIRATTVISGYATPATTSAVTYKVRGMADTANTTLRVRNDRATGQMYAIEVSA